MSKFSQKGISLFLAIIILTIILAIVLGLTAILVGQIKTIRGMGYSVVALYAADTGVERVLKDFFDGNPLQDHYDSEKLENKASYEMRIACCSTLDPECYFSSNPLGETCEDYVQDSDGVSDENSNCEATKLCIRSVGTFEDSKRAIEVKIYPRIITP